MDASSRPRHQRGSVHSAARVGARCSNGSSQMTITNTTRWRDDPIIPTDYTDVAQLVRLARGARGRIVEFDWAFTREDLLRFRSAVFDWGSRVTGRYRVFDAQMLRAVNAALGDMTTMQALPMPKNSASVDCAVKCEADGEVFRIAGHAPLDIIIGYGMAGVGNSPATTLHLGPTASSILADAVGLLGWDLVALRAPGLSPVLNVLYGNAPNYGIHNAEVPKGPPLDVAVRFEGPFSLGDEAGVRCLFHDDIASRSGVYLWTVPVGEVELPWYVGQTRRGFGQRMGEHVTGFLSGQYAVQDAAALATGRNARASGTAVGLWPGVVPSVLANYVALADNVQAVVRMLRIHVAPLSDDAHVLNRVEGAIGRFFKNHSEARIREFFFPGMRVPAAIPFDRALRIALSSQGAIEGLPSEICE